MELARLLDEGIPRCTRLAAQVWLLARTSLHRGEVVQREILLWVLSVLVRPFLQGVQRGAAHVVSRRASELRATLGDAAETICEAMAWAEFRGHPAGAEHWEPLSGHWSIREQEADGQSARARVARIAADVAYAADAICCAAPLQLADALRRVVDAVVVVGTTEEASIAVEHLFERQWGSDLRALVDARADLTWAALARAEADGRPMRWDDAQRRADSGALAGIMLAGVPAELRRWDVAGTDGAQWERMRLRVASDLVMGLSPIEVLALRRLGLDGSRGARLRIEGRLTLLLREACFDGDSFFASIHAVNANGGAA